jgi:uncharacterized OB-fold protein
MNTPKKSQLLAERCLDCGEILFPKRVEGFCICCQSKRLQEIKLSTRGKIFSYTVVMQRPPVYYLGEVPYAFGYVELPEGVRVETLFASSNLDDLRIGMEVDLVVEKLHEDQEGNEVRTYKFRASDESGLDN